MDAYRGYGDRSAVFVVTGVVDSLHIKGNVYAFAQLPVVVSLEDLLGSIMESPIAQVKAEAPGRQVIAMAVGNAIDYPCEPDLVLRPRPAFALQEETG